MSAKIKLIVFLVPWTVLGFYAKHYQGPLDFWVNNSLGGVFYVVFWVQFAYLFFLFFGVFARTGWVVIAVLITTCILECLQLSKAPILTSIRSHYLGRVLIGNTFAFSDFFYYIAGALLALPILKKLARD